MRLNLFLKKISRPISVKKTKPRKCPANAVLVIVQSPNNLVRYGMVGDADDMFYFSIDPLSGEIFVRRSLVETTNRNITLFQVSWLLSPSGLFLCTSLSPTLFLSVPVDMVDICL